MVELRKRKAPAPPPVAKKSKPAPKPKESDTTSQAVAGTVPLVDKILNLENFGGEIETNDGAKTTLKALVEKSTSGVVLFTYPKASTPGCTKQACLFRDNHAHLTSTGLSIYGLSTDSPKANTTFKTKQSLSYPLLCDPSATLIAAIGFKKVPKGTTRGVFALDKKGKVLLRETGGPDATVDAVQKLVAEAPSKEETTNVNSSDEE
ncbi:uncharacterized protein N7459_009806 [Penicillium hispanicum]|uniref:uncharacterized protein n=1 Tax=Penicillium hispanicum TaxID=1080232 RepID=UPI00253FB7EE|nr:uncharacterized protein N7459_009806 [Penicillium hispanicum]KAJ5570376.1 hypothetical protein N7459_009806 [Penicillium hispanicum]